MKKVKKTKQLIINQGECFDVIVITPVGKIKTRFAQDGISSYIRNDSDSIQYLSHFSKIGFAK
jgi:hypothetical protein